MEAFAVFSQITLSKGTGPNFVSSGKCSVTGYFLHGHRMSGGRTPVAGRLLSWRLAPCDQQVRLPGAKSGASDCIVTYV